MSKLIFALSNLLLVIPFLKALINPEQNIDFIYDASIMLFIAEFLSIHSSVLLSGALNIPNKYKVILFGAYAFFVIILLTFTKSRIIIFYLLISLVTKFFISREIPDINRATKSTKCLIITVFAVLIFSPILRTLIPFTDEILNAKPINASGLFVETPQTILVWGIIYPIGLFISEFLPSSKS